MENIAHTLCGLRIADLGWRERVGPRAPLIAALAANLPDADIALRLLGSDTYAWWHRGITHSVLGWPVLALGAAWASRRATGNGRYRDHLALWLWGLLSHMLLDWPTSWGTMLFLPLTDTRFSLDWIFIVDPAFWVCLGLLPWAVRRAVGGADIAGGRHTGARAGLFALAGWVLFCGAMRQQAGTHAPQGTAVFPAPLAPARWTGLHTHDGSVDRWLLTPASGTLAGTWSAITEAERVTLRTLRAGDRWLWKAKAPAVAARTERTEGTELDVIDLAYASWLSGEAGARRFGDTFTLGANGTIVRGSGSGVPASTRGASAP